VDAHTLITVAARRCNDALWRYYYMQNVTALLV